MGDVRWEPVWDGFVHEHDTGIALDVRYVAWQGDDNSINVGRVDYGPHGNCPLPPDIRLCRAVPVTWSQEPPTEPGRYWAYCKTWFEPMQLVEVFVEDRLVEDHLRVKYMWEDDTDRLDQLHGIHWLPATVPQPPGEVGP